MTDLPKGITFRDETVDRPIWHESIDLNCYRLPEAFSPDDIFLDIGSHTGSVTWLAATRGAKVFAVEACRGNFALLLKHIEEIEDKVVPIHAACWRSDQGLATLRFSKNWHPANTGGGCTMEGAGIYDVTTIALDDILRLVGEARFCKMDVEGAEMPILFSAKELRRIKEMAIEYHERPEYRHEIANVGPAFTVANLAWHIKSHGFFVEVEPKGPGMGLLFAKREER